MSEIWLGCCFAPGSLQTLTLHACPQKEAYNTDADFLGLQYHNIFALVRELGIENPFTDWTTSGFWSPQGLTTEAPVFSRYITWAFEFINMFHTSVLTIPCTFGKACGQLHIADVHVRYLSLFLQAPAAAHDAGPICAHSPALQVSHVAGSLVQRSCC